jgi:hypothetical protein
MTLAFLILATPTNAQDVTLAPGEEWSGVVTLPGGLLSLEARRVAAAAEGGCYALEVIVNGTPLTRPLFNKAATFAFADGRVFSYRSPAAARWMVFSSPDYDAHNRGDGDFHVVTDDGAAYRYVWDLAATLESPAANVRIRNVADDAGELAVRFVRDEPGQAWPVTAVRDGEALRASFRVAGVPPLTALAARWTYRGAETLVLRTDDTVLQPGEDVVAFVLQPLPAESGWPAGIYGIDLFAGDTLLLTTTFVIDSEE